MGLTSKVALTMAASAVGALMIAGGSFAMFNASAGPNSQTFAAGTVKIADIKGLCWSGVQDFANLEPGDNGTASVTFKNTGSLDEWVSLESLLQGSTTAGTADIFGTTYANDNNPLGISYTVQLLDSSGNTITNAQFGGDGQTNNEAVNFFANKSASSGTLAEGPVQSGTFFLPAGDSAKVTYNWSFPTTAGNDYQGATGTMTINADAIQASNNIAFANSVGTGPDTPPTVSLNSPS